MNLLSIASATRMHNALQKTTRTIKVSFVTPGEPSIGSVLFRIAQDAQRQQSRGRTTDLFHPLHLSASHLAQRQPSDGQRQRLWDTPLWLTEERDGVPSLSQAASFLQKDIA